MRKRYQVNAVYPCRDEIWLKAKVGTKVSYESTPFRIMGTELEEVYYTYGRLYPKDHFEPVARPPDAELLLKRLSTRRETPPIEYKAFQCEYRMADGTRCEVRPEPQKRRDPHYCWEHQPKGRIPVCEHKWSIHLPCADCGPDPQIRKGFGYATPDRKPSWRK
jgi:hypothetical protein